MLIKTDSALYTALKDVLFYQDNLSLDYTPDSAPRVVRFNTSEYVDTLSNPKIPSLAIEYVSDDYDDEERPPLATGSRIWTHTDITKDEAVLNRRPIPVIVEYILHVRSPKDLWTRQIEAEVARLLMPLYEITLQANVFGDPTLLMDIPIRYRFQNFTRRPIFDRQERMFESRAPIKVLTWLLPSNTSIELRTTYKSANVSILTLSDDQLDNFVVTGG